MKPGAKRNGMSTGTVVFITLSAGAFVFLMIPVVLVGNPNLVGPIMGDQFAETSVTNDCGETLLVAGSARESPAVSAAWASVEPGKSFHVLEGDDYAVRVSGGIWVVHRTQGPDSDVIAKSECPTEATPEELVAARVPILAGAEVISVEVAPLPPLADAPLGAEITTVVARVPLDQAADWISEYAMAPDPTAGRFANATREQVAPGATWSQSAAFDSIIGAQGVDAVAVVDPATGVVVVRLKDSPPSF